MGFECAISISPGFSWLTLMYKIVLCHGCLSYLCHVSYICVVYVADEFNSTTPSLLTTLFALRSMERLEKNKRYRPFVMNALRLSRLSPVSHKGGQTALRHGGNFESRSMWWGHPNIRLQTANVQSIYVGRGGVNERKALYILYALIPW